MDIKPAIAWIFATLATCMAALMCLNFMLSANALQDVSASLPLLTLAGVAVVAAWCYPNFWDTAGASATGMLAGLALFIASLWRSTAPWAEGMRYQVLLHGQIMFFCLVVFAAIGTCALCGWGVGAAFHILMRQRARLKLSRRR